MDRQGGKALDNRRRHRAGPSTAMSALVIDNIGQLVTCDPERGDGPLGIRTDAALVIEDGIVAEVATAGRAAGDDNLDACGRAVIPGFVDSHTHLVFAG